MALGAYFSNQGIPFAQSVGGLGGVGLLSAYQDGSLGGVGPLTAFQDGSLGRIGPLRAHQDGSLGAPESTTTTVQDGRLVETWESKPVLNNGNAQWVTVEEGTASNINQAECIEACTRPAIPLQSLQVKVGPANSWHDGIFQADSDSGAGALQAFQSGSLGMPLYIDGREVNRPITIHHGPVQGMGEYFTPTSGCGVCGCDGCGCGGCEGMSGTDLSAYSNYFLYGGLALLGVGAFFLMKK